MIGRSEEWTGGTKTAPADKSNTVRLLAQSKLGRGHHANKIQSEWRQEATKFFWHPHEGTTCIEFPSRWRHATEKGCAQTNNSTMHCASLPLTNQEK